MEKVDVFGKNSTRSTTPGELVDLDEEIRTKDTGKQRQLHDERNIQRRERERERETRAGEYNERQVPSCGPVNILNPTSTAANQDI